MNICCLNVDSKVHLKLEAARHTLTAPKSLPVGAQQVFTKPLILSLLIPLPTLTLFSFYTYLFNQIMFRAM